MRPDDLDAIAVTAGPGLARALLVGVAAAKSYALALDKPLYGVNHLSSHLAVDSFGAAVVGGLVVAVLSWLAEVLLPLRRD